MSSGAPTGSVMRRAALNSLRVVFVRGTMAAASFVAAACAFGGDNRNTAAASASGALLQGSRSVADGVETVLHSASAFADAPQWTIDTAPVMIAGGPSAPPEFDLTWAHKVELLSDGALVTYASIGTRLLLFSADGKAERMLGRHGRGPGEFWNADMTRGAGDTIIMLDGVNNRLSKVLRDGTFPFERTLAKPVSRIARMVGALDDGRLILSEAGVFPKSTETARPASDKSDTLQSPPAPIYVLRPDSGHSQIALVADMQMGQIEIRNGDRAYMSRRPVRYSSMAHAIAWDSSIVTSAGAIFEIDRRDSAGKIRSRIVSTSKRRAVIQAMIDAEISAELERSRSTRGEGGYVVSEEERQRRVREVPVADSLPAIQFLFTSPDQLLWAVDGFAIGDSAITATAFNRDGAIVRRLHIPRFGIPMTFGTDRVVLREEDADGVISMRVYKLIPKAN